MIEGSKSCWIELGHIARFGNRSGVAVGATVIATCDWIPGVHCPPDFGALLLVESGLAFRFWVFVRIALVVEQRDGLLLFNLGSFRLRPADGLLTLPLLRLLVSLIKCKCSGLNLRN